MTATIMGITATTWTDREMSSFEHIGLGIAILRARVWVRYGVNNRESGTLRISLMHLSRYFQMHPSHPYFC